MAAAAVADTPGCDGDGDATASRGGRPGIGYSGGARRRAGDDGRDGTSRRPGGSAGILSVPGSLDGAAAAAVAAARSHACDGTGPATTPCNRLRP